MVSPPSHRPDLRHGAVGPDEADRAGDRRGECGQGVALHPVEQGRLFEVLWQEDDIGCEPRDGVGHRRRARVDGHVGGGADAGISCRAQLLGEVSPSDRIEALR